jgi:radical SAM superfamily enzyme YgiQ (UPF0313 family)
MRILFLNLNWGQLVSGKTFKIHFSLPPLDLLLMHNFAIEAGENSTILDGFVEDVRESQSELDEADWILATTTPYHMWQCPNVDWNLIKQSIDILPKEKTVLCGLHPSIFPEQTLRETGVHAVIRREPEVVFKQFLKTPKWQDLPGVSYLQDDQYVENSPAALPSMDDLVVQNYDLDISKYAYFLLGKKTGVFESSRGCPWKCTFCDQEMFSWKYRLKSPEVFVQEVIRGVKQTGMRHAYFYDLEFTVREKRTLEICEGLARANTGLEWACQTRADMVDEVTLRAMKEAGCKLIHFGVESANPEILKSTNKKITLEKIEKGLKLAKEAGLQTACFFMFGLPDEDPDTFDVTLEFARSVNPTYASFHFAVPFPGTPLYSRYIEEKKLDWGVWPSLYFDAWDREDIKSYLSKAYSAFYLRPKRFEMREFAYRLENFPDKFAHFRAMKNA